MAIGGYRVGAGRRSRWSRPTKMIRLPAEFEPELVQLAHQLDEGQQAFTRSDLDGAIESVLLSMPPLRRREANRLFKKLRCQLLKP
jgi:hypothetical protein